MNADEIVRALRDAEGNNELDCEISELRPLLLKVADLIESLQAQLARETKSANTWILAANDYRKKPDKDGAGQYKIARTTCRLTAQGEGGSGGFAG